VLRSVCSAVGRIMNLEEELKQNVPEIKRQKAESFIKNILQNQKSDHCLPTQNQVEEVMKFDNRNKISLTKLVMLISFYLKYHQLYSNVLGLVSASIKFLRMVYVV
jgi:hypothetical protein